MHTAINMGGGSSGPSSPNIYITSPTATSAPPRYPQQPVSILSHSPFAFTSPGNSKDTLIVTGSMDTNSIPSIGSRAHSFPHLQGHPFGSSRSGSPNGTNGPSHSNPTSGAGERGSDMMDMFDEMSSPVLQPSDLHSASSSSASVNLTGSDGHSPDESSAGGLSAHHGDGPGDEPGSQPITGRGSSKRQRMSVSDTAPSSAHEDMMMSNAFGMNMSMSSVSGALAGMNNPSMINVGGMNGGSGSSESLLGMENGMGNMSSHSLNLSLSNASLSPPDNPKRLSTRARSDSAPLYHQQHLAPSSSSPVHGWGAGRPRSGSGLGTLGNHHQHNQYGGSHVQRGLTIPSITMPRAGLNGIGGMGVQTVPSNVQGQGR
ncbi:hypothetical protein BT96DRAFT_988445 [Gymnopus androsaceus JB14]|uniref:Uncharacterized protein n=1 Tax=Gymnopus androsaceus JB14 TaxID=1447944 RepID=A0A6A4I675_9AGAR|nr:hypothetical protein BT96DRAFT_988445 [Gymnopus androsaceus JB14]